MRRKSKEPPTLGRRDFLKAAGVLALAVGTPKWAEAYFVNDFPVRTVENETFRFDPQSGVIRWDGGKRTEPYMFSIGGLARKPLKLSYADLRALPYVKQVSDFHCVEGWSVKDVAWGGFRFDEIIKMAGPEARYAVFHALGNTIGRPGRLNHYVESHPVGYLTDLREKCLMALDMEGRPLPHDHGAPMRLVAPYTLGYKNIKYVASIEFAEAPRAGWWTEANPIYPIIAPVPPSRLRSSR